MPTVRLTKKCVDAMAPSLKDSFLWDADIRGFGLKVTPKGAKTYVLQYRLGGRGAPTKRYTIGAHGSPWTPDSARRRAIDLLVLIGNGKDPLEAERDALISNKELAFEHYVQTFVERYLKRAQARSWRQAQSVLLQHAVPRFRSKPLTAIARREIAGLIEDVGHSRQATARYLHATLRKLFRWSVSRGDLELSPMADMPAPKGSKPRDRVLADAELATVWHGSEKLGFPFCHMFRLLIATGQRREEVSGINWAEIDLDNGLWTIPAERSKNGVAHIVPLSGLALEILTKVAPRSTSGLVFTVTGHSPPSGWSKAKRRLDRFVAEEMIVPDWRTHDLRRTVATGLQRLGVRFEVTEAVLNHLSGSRSGVAGVYQRHDWALEKRRALEAWGQALSDLVSARSNSLNGSAGTNIIQFNPQSNA